MTGGRGGRSGDERRAICFSVGSNCTRSNRRSPWRFGGEPRPERRSAITKIVLTGPTPVFANASFGTVGAYEQFDGTPMARSIRWIRSTR